MYDINEIQSIVNRIAVTLPISKVILIASYVKYEATEKSDIDLFSPCILRSKDLKLS